MKTNKNKIKGFTLVELLAVIVILAVILVIAVPKVMSVIEDSKKATLESTAKMIASAAEKAKVQNTVLGKEENITCDSVAKINDINYDRCIIEFDDNGNSLVTIKGSGKFANLNVCEGNKTNSTASHNLCEGEYGKANTYIEKIEAYNGEENGLIVDTTIDKNLRYIGANPNNYVYFNCKDKDLNNVNYGEESYDYANSCEIWRIIGVFDTYLSETDTIGTKRIKIVRDQVLSTTMVWDESEDESNYYNQWGPSAYVDGTIYEGADLMQYLNGETEGNYYYSLSSIAKQQISAVMWHTGTIQEPTNNMLAPETAYNEENSNTTSTGTTVVYTTTWLGKIGLIYLSDYAYAGGSECTNIRNISCGKNNWLKPTLNSWTISSSKDDGFKVWRIYSSGNAQSNDANIKQGIYPSLYLSSNVKIIGGNGADEPYKLAL